MNVRLKGAVLALGLAAGSVVETVSQTSAGRGLPAAAGVQRRTHRARQQWHGDRDRDVPVLRR